MAILLIARAVRTWLRGIGRIFICGPAALNVKFGCMRKARPFRALVPLVCVCSLHAALPQPARAENPFGADEGKLQLTAGFNDVDGAGGGGLVPWAIITGYGSEESWGANAHLTTVQLGDFELRTLGAAVGLFDRLEISYATQDFDVTSSALDGLNVSQDIFGLKVRLAGDAVYDQDRKLPQISLGLQHKRHGGINDADGVGAAGLVSPTQLGAEDDDGTDIYIAATKVFLRQRLLVNGALRYTKANQLGLLGFGGLNDSEAVLEATAAFIVSRTLAVGVEYRDKPDNLLVDEEGAAWDVFVAWTPTKNISFVGAFVDLGEILSPVIGRTDNQTGQYLSFQIGF